MAKSNKGNSVGSFWHNFIRSNAVRMLVLSILFLFAAPALVRGVIVTDYSKIYYSPQVIYPNAQFAKPKSMAYDRQVFATEAYVYALESNTKISVWRNSITGTNLVKASFNGLASGQGYTFGDVQGLAKHPSENIIAIVDKGVAAQRVVVYSFEETSAGATFTYLGQYGSGEWSNPNREIVSPYGVTFSADGKIHVLNSNVSGANNGNSIVVLSGAYSNLSVENVIGLSNLLITSGAAGSPITGLGLTGIAIDEDTGNYFLANPERNNIIEITSDIAFVRAYGAMPNGSSNHLSRPSNVALWKPGIKDLTFLFTVDQNNNRIVVYIANSDSSLSIPASGFFTSFGGADSGSGQPGKMNRPYGIFIEPVDTDNVILYVADSSAGRVQKFNFNIYDVDNDSNGVPDLEELEYVPPAVIPTITITAITDEYLAFKIPADSVIFDYTVLASETLVPAMAWNPWVVIPASMLTASSTHFTVPDLIFGGSVSVDVEYNVGDVEIFIDMENMFTHEWRMYFKIKTEY